MVHDPTMQKLLGQPAQRHRDATMILVAYRHGLRASELVDLRWDQFDFDTANLSVRRAKKGSPSTHPIRGDELRALRKLQREQEPKSPFVFASERGSPFTTAGFARMVERAGMAAELDFKAHPHMLRHACASRWPIKATTRAPCSLIWVTGTFNTRFVTPSCPQIVSRTSGAERTRPGRTEPCYNRWKFTIAGCAHDD